ncbi:MAG: GerMN domain-containing protein [Candidatus Nealsonbacteria bacterium]|nr:GerMN domain-containing protein [Candidatus Nealsonbacteria bacterium]
MKKLLYLIVIFATGVGLAVYLTQKPLEKIEDKSDLIKVFNPEPNEKIKTPLLISGEARGTWFFEASFPIELLDERGNSLAIVVAQAKDDWMTANFVPFEATLDFPPSLSGKGTLIFKKDNPSGLPEFDDEFSLPIVFEPQESIKVKAFVNTSKMDPEFSCNKVFPVEREVVKTEAVARAALEELLKGPTRKELAEEFFTSLNPGVKIQRLTVENGTAKVDFDETLQFQVGGSCRVSAIRAQISNTLKQFPTVEDVVISIDNRTEDILQP